MAVSDYATAGAEVGAVLGGRGRHLRRHGRLDPAGDRAGDRRRADRRRPGRRRGRLDGRAVGRGARRRLGRLGSPQSDRTLEYRDHVKERQIPRPRPGRPPTRSSTPERCSITRPSRAQTRGNVAREGMKPDLRRETTASADRQRRRCCRRTIRRGSPCVRASTRTGCTAACPCGTGEVPARRERAAAAAGQQDRQVVRVVAVAVGHGRAEEHHAVVQQRAVALADRRHPAQHVGELLDVPALIFGTARTSRPCSGGARSRGGPLHALDEREVLAATRRWRT